MAAAAILKRAAGPLRRSAWKLIEEPTTRMAVLPRAATSVSRSNLLAPMPRFASTQREVAQDNSLLRILRDEISHEEEEYEPSRVRSSPSNALPYLHLQGALTDHAPDCIPFVSVLVLSPKFTTLDAHFHSNQFFEL